MKLLIYVLLAVSLTFISCDSQHPYYTQLRELKVRYGGKWSMSEYEACPLLIVENSERIKNSPDSLMIYIDEISKLSIDIEPKRCLSFEVRNKTGNSMFSATQSDIYVLRPKR